MRSYKTVTGKKTYSGYSGKAKVSAIPATPEFQLKKKGSRIEIRIQSSEKRSGWQIAIEDAKGTSQKIVKNVKQTSVTSVKAEKGKRYHFTIRTCQMISGKKVYSKWAPAKTMKM